MKTFISWSGNLSKQIAAELNDWPPKVIQAIKPFYSSDDIGIGNRWFSEVETKLSSADFGILCLTKENNTETSTDEFTYLKKEFEEAKAKAKYIFDILLPKIFKS